MTSSSALSLLGARIDGQFEVESVLAGGAFATVYRARQLGIDRAIALKVPTHEIASDPVMAKRFAREARAAARIRHPGVVTIYAVGELPDGRPYLAMELVDGEPLTKILEGGRVPARRALRIGRLIASALSDTHAADVIHRDLKPSNIIWRRDRNGDDRVAIVDFGIAVCKPGNADASRLTEGGLIGTPHYMSPEQAHGEAVDGRADLYALGCILFELVTGSTLFEGSGYEVMLAHLGKAPPRARDRVPSVSPELDALIGALLAKRPQDRPATADVVVARIDEALARRDLSEPDRAAWRGSAVDEEPARRDTTTLAVGERRARWIVGLTIATLALTGGGLVLAKLLSGGGGPVTEVAAPPKPGERSVTRDDGETTLHMTLPDPIHAGVPIAVHFQLWNKLGQPITEVPVLTIEDPRGSAKGFNARARGGNEFELSRTLRVPGRYVLRVFPAGTDSELDVELDAER